MPLGNGVKLTWFGHSTFLLETPGGKRVLFDPWFEGNPACPDGMRDPGDVDVILVSHGHSDHTASLVDIARAKSPKAIVAMIELGDWLGAKGIENVVGMNKGGTTQVEGLSVTMVHADHSSSWGEEDGSITYLGEPAGFVVGLENGYRIYFAGDTAVFGDMRLIAELYQPDLAMLPIGDFFTMGPREAAKAVELLGVSRVVPMHYGTFPALTGTPQALRDQAMVSGLEVYELEPGGTLE